MSLNSRLYPILGKINMKSINPVIYRFVSNIKPEDEVTHTGQKWESDDYRLVRFTHAPKLVNKNWAVKLIEATPTTQTTQRVVWCDGGSGPEGHPRVYINLVDSIKSDIFEQINLPTRILVPLYRDALPSLDVSLLDERIVMLERCSQCGRYSDNDGSDTDKPGAHACGYCGLRFEQIH